MPTTVSYTGSGDQQIVPSSWFKSQGVNDQTVDAIWNTDNNFVCTVSDDAASALLKASPGEFQQLTAPLPSEIGATPPIAAWNSNTEYPVNSLVPGINGDTAVYIALVNNLDVEPTPANSATWFQLVPPTSGGAAAIALSTITAAGDLVVGTGAGAVERLGIGTAGQVLTVGGNDPSGLEWATPSGGGSGIPLSTVTTAGDIIAATGNGVVERLGKGSAGQVLTVGGTDASGLEWATPAAPGIPQTTITASGDMLVGTGNDAVARLGIGTSGQVLTVGGTGPGGLEWTTPTASVPLATFTAKGDLLAATGNGAVERLPIGSAGQVLTVGGTDASGLEWATPSTGSGGIPESVVTAVGDILVASAAGTVTRLGIGTAGQVLTVGGSNPGGLEWATPASGGSGIPESVVTTAGDMLVASGNATVTRLPVGTSGQVLTVGGTGPGGLEWTTPSTGSGGVTSVTAGNGTITIGGTATAPTVAATVGTAAGTVAAGNDSRIVGAIQNSLVTTAGDLIVATANATLERLGIGTSGQVLTIGGADASGLEWATPTAPVPLSLFTTKGDILAATGSGAVERLPIGATGQVLTVGGTDASGLEWATPSGGGSNNTIAPAQNVAAGGTVTLDPTQGAYLRVTLTGSPTTITVQNWPTGVSTTMTVDFVTSGTPGTGYTLPWTQAAANAAGFFFASNSVIQPSPNVGDVTTVTLECESFVSGSPVLKVRDAGTFSGA